MAISWLMSLTVGSAGALVLVLAASTGVAKGEPPIGPPAAPAILQGVDGLSAPGVPGSVVVWGEHAEAIVCGGREGRREAVVAAARLGRGRIVAFGHTGYADAATLDDPDTRRVFVNAAKWSLGEGTPAPIGVIGGTAAGVLREAGLEAESAELRDLAEGLSRWRAVVLLRDSLDKEQVRLLHRFVEEGGGLIVAQTGWGWRQIHSGRDLRENAINQALAPAGLAFGEGTPDTANGGRYDARAALSELVNASRAIAVIEGDEKALPKSELAQAELTLLAAARVVPRDDPVLRPRLAALRTRGGDRVPSAARPLRRDEVSARVGLALSMEELDAMPLEACAAHPASEDFPGPIPAGTPRGRHTRTIDTRVPGWHSLGLYAAPGETITLHVPAHAAKAGLDLQIGSHTDELWHHDAWKRVPRVARRAPIRGEATRLASPFGGIVYVDVPRSCSLGVIEIAVSGVAESPLFVRGKTDPARWRGSIRHAPAPWGELASGKVIVTVPSELLRGLDDPEGVLDVWDRVLDAAADLATIPRERARPERYVCDVQISAGYMHSGYPIMTHLDAAGAMASREKLLAGNWGLFHELGHNHQEREWTFSGTGEVTCNLFSLYIMETVCATPPEQAHEANDQTAARIAKYFDKPASLERWQQDPFTALVMYRQMREAFGWETYKKVFAEYRALAPDDRPKSDPEKRDQWMERMSRASGKNLAPFFERWGVTITPQAAERVNTLDAWMPPGMEP